MKTPMKELKRSARRTAESRGHFLSTWFTSVGVPTAICKRCRGKVEIIGNEIVGEVITTPCNYLQA
jgi:hypothetical protein